jgi:hypothetical protein
MRVLEHCNRIFDAFLAGEALEEFQQAGEDRPTADISCVEQIASSYVGDLHAWGARYLGALESAVRFAGTVRGGATVLALSHGVNLRPEVEFLETYQAVFGPRQTWKVRDVITNNDPNAPALDRLLRLGAEQGVTLSFLDPSTTPVGSRSARRRNLVTGATSPMEVAYLAPRQDLQRIAGATGGTLVADAGIDDGLRELCRRDRGRYVLGFYADRPLTKAELHGIEVSTRREDVTIRTGRAVDVRNRTREWAPGTIVLEDSRPAGGEAGGRFIPFRLHARPRDLGYEREGDEMVANLALHVRVLTSDGRYLADRYEFFRHGYPATRPSSGKPLVLSVRGWLEAEPGGYRIEASFRNPKTGNEVMIFHEIEVPPAGAEAGEAPQRDVP